MVPGNFRALRNSPKAYKQFKRVDTANIIRAQRRKGMNISLRIKSSSDKSLF